MSNLMSLSFFFNHILVVLIVNFKQTVNDSTLFWLQCILLDNLIDH